MYKLPGRHGFENCCEAFENALKLVVKHASVFLWMLQIG